MLAVAGLAAVVARRRRGRGRGRRDVRLDAVPGLVRRAVARLDQGAGPRASSRSWPAPSSPRPANTITITDVQGFQRTIHTTSATTYEDGLTATPAAGTRIYAVGTVDTDKTSLKATRVGKLPDRPEGRGFPGRGFPGHGPGRHHDRDGDQGGDQGGTPATPTPTPSPTA